MELNIRARSALFIVLYQMRADVEDDVKEAQRRKEKVEALLKDCRALFPGED